MQTKALKKGNGRQRARHDTTRTLMEIFFLCLLLLLRRHSRSIDHVKVNTGETFSCSVDNTKSTYKSHTKEERGFSGERMKSLIFSHFLSTYYIFGGKIPVFFISRSIYTFSLCLALFLALAYRRSRFWWGLLGLLFASWLSMSKRVLWRTGALSFFLLGENFFFFCLSLCGAVYGNESLIAWHHIIGDDSPAVFAGSSGEQEEKIRNSFPEQYSARNCTRRKHSNALGY